MNHTRLSQWLSFDLKSMTIFCGFKQVYNLKMVLRNIHHVLLESMLPYFALMFVLIITSRDLSRFSAYLDVHSRTCIFTLTFEGQSFR